MHNFNLAPKAPYYLTRLSDKSLEWVRQAAENQIQNYSDGDQFCGLWKFLRNRVNQEQKRRVDCDNGKYQEPESIVQLPDWVEEEWAYALEQLTVFSYIQLNLEVAELIDWLVVRVSYVCADIIRKGKYDPRY